MLPLDLPSRPVPYHFTLYPSNQFLYLSPCAPPLGPALKDGAIPLHPLPLKSISVPITLRSTPWTCPQGRCHTTSPSTPQINFCTYHPALHPLDLPSRPVPYHFTLSTPQIKFCTYHPALHPLDLPSRHVAGQRLKVQPSTLQSLPEQFLAFSGPSPPPIQQAQGVVHWLLRVTSDLHQVRVVESEVADKLLPV